MGPTAETLDATEASPSGGIGVETSSGIEAMESHPSSVDGETVRYKVSKSPRRWHNRGNFPLCRVSVTLDAS